MMKTIMLITILTLSACASVDPQELQKARVECSLENPVMQTPIQNYYNCVQSREPFGAYKKDKKNAEKTSQQNLSDIDFIYAAPKEDQPWLMMDVSIRELAKGNVKASRQLLEKVADNIEVIYGNSEKAKRARELFSHEAEKNFIGESHERAMTFHYLGLLDLFKGDYQNARASFRASVLQDSIALNEKYEKDFSSSLWLQGWAAQCSNSNKASRFFRQAKETFSTPAPKQKNNLLVVAEIGAGPFKITQGEFGEKLAYSNRPATPIETSFRPTSFNLYKANNIHFQAATRGDRSFDDYLASKASTKENLRDFAEGAFYTGLVALELASRMSHLDGDAAGVAAAVGAVSLLAAGISYGISKATNSIADIRTWRSLPREIYLGSFSVPASTNSFSSLRKTPNKKLRNLISYTEKNKRAGLMASLFSGKGKCRVLFLKDISN